MIINEGSVSKFQSQGYQTTQNSYPTADGSRMKLAFSKTVSSGSYSPIMGTAMNTYIPCSGYDRERLILSGYDMQQVKFSLEKEDPIETCPAQEWRSDTTALSEETSTSRYRVVGHVPLSSLQESSGVNRALEEIVPSALLESDDPSFGMGYRKQIRLDLLTRHRYKWDIFCQ